MFDTAQIFFVVGSCGRNNEFHQATVFALKYTNNTRAFCWKLKLNSQDYHLMYNRSGWWRSRFEKLCSGRDAMAPKKWLNHVSSFITKSKLFVDSGNGKFWRDDFFDAIKQKAIYNLSTKWLWVITSKALKNSLSTKG